VKIQVRHIFLFLSTTFLVYSLSIYLYPLAIKSNSKFDKNLAADGRLIWQKYNCQTCHQFYGLGGYLGPDLTNIISKKGKGEAVIRALLKSGTKQMPAYHLQEEEISLLLEFLKSTDASGSSDARDYETTNYLMIEQKKKP
jgi:nitric oxide reductase subunit C